MRRKDREITDLNEIVKVMKKCDSCTLALCDGKTPYAVTLNFGEVSENGRVKLYFHSAGEGQKLDIIRKNPQAAFTMNCGHELVVRDNRSRFTMEYESVSGSGTIGFVERGDRKKAMDVIMEHYAGEEGYQINEKVLEVTELFCMTVETITGKRNRDKHD